MSLSSQIVATLLRWCTANDIRIDPRIQIVHNQDTGAAIYAKNTQIPTKASLVHIHRNSVLSVRSCCLSDEIEPVIYGPEAQLSLSLALYAELLLGSASRWAAYLQSLPENLVPLPLFWTHGSSNDDDLVDGKEGLEWLRGTELEKHLSKHPEYDLEKITAYYFGSAEPLLLRWAKQLDSDLENEPSVNGFYRAYALVSSRAFLVDAYHGLSMVPIADIFNHSQQNHVHLETEFDVCSHCGLLEQCPHDIDEPSIENVSKLRDPSSSQGKELDPYYEMVSVSQIQPGEEVYNTYGETLNNAQLLIQYGFVLDVNENDRLHWDLEEVYKCFTRSSSAQPLDLMEIETIWKAVLKSVDLSRVSRRIRKSGLVSLHTHALDSCLHVDGEGKVSYQLWVLLVLPLCVKHSIEGSHEKLISAVADIDAVFELLLTMEDSAETNAGRGIDDQEAFEARVSILTGFAHSLMDLCDIRKSSLGKDLPDTTNINEILDEIPVERIRTRNALNIVISERSILDSCISTWGDIAASLHQ